MANTYTPEQIALFERVLVRRRDVEAHLRHLDRIDAEHNVGGRRSAASRTTLRQRVLARQRDVEAHLRHLERIDAAKYIVNGRRCIRIRPEPADRSLEEETAANEQRRAYHNRREEEEIAVQERRHHAYSSSRRLWYARFCSLAANVQKLRCYESDGVPASTEPKIAAILQKEEEDIASFFFYINHRIRMIIAKRKALSWTCPNDGRAYEFVWEDQRFLRTYSGEIWRDAAVMVDGEPHCIPVLGQQCGQWTGYYITSAPLIMDEPADPAPRQ